MKNIGIAFKIGSFEVGQGIGAANGNPFFFLASVKIFG